MLVVHINVIGTSHYTDVKRITILHDFSKKFAKSFQETFSKPLVFSTKYVILLIGRYGCSSIKGGDVP